MELTSLAFPLLGAISLGGLLSIIYAAIGLGFVIFFHELGHFAVAKWCDVKVERFSLGFGPILWRFKRGETEYALSAIPFGGYVKMLGQDDMDPSQLTTEEIALDPRSFSAKSVPQRMAIISAGVIMNVITGLLFFAIAFWVGVRQVPSVVGGAQVGFPAWEAGIRSGDTITDINGRRIRSFGDIMRAVALSSSDELEIKGSRANGKPFQVTIAPYKPGDNDKVTRRIIGVGPMWGLEIAKTDEADFQPVYPGSAASRAEPALEQGGTVVKANGIEVSDYPDLEAIAIENRAESLVLHIRPDGVDESSDELVKVTIPPQAFRTIGLGFEIGEVAAVRAGSPAAAGGLRKGDKITLVEGVAVGNELDPFRLPNLFHQYAVDRPGEPVEVKYIREQTEETTDVVPEPIAGWTETPLGEDVPLSIPSIGLAFHVLPQVARVDANVTDEIATGDRLVAWELVKPEDAEDDLYPKELKFELGKENRNVAFAFWSTQQLAQRSVRLTVVDAAGDQKTVEIDPVDAKGTEDEPGWYVPDTRGIRFFRLAQRVDADDFGDAFGVACAHTRDSITDIYLTLRNLFTGDLSPTELNGPIKIGKVAYQIAKDGVPELLMFLGFLSMNLAVLNFLPIPLLDGGHMVFLIWEGVTRRKPSEGVLIAATYVGMIFVLGLLGFVLYLDLFVH